jgi:DNA-directed RNA polymerase subunit beta
MATPVFDGAFETEIKSLLKLAGQSESGQSWLLTVVRVSVLIAR